MTAAQEWILVERRQQIMATGMSVHVAVPPAEKERAEHAIADCLAWLEEIGRSLTRFDPASELSQLNRASGSWHAVSDTLYTVVEQSVAAAEATDGLFHPATLSALEAAGYDRDYDEIAQREIGIRVAPPPLIDWREIALDPVRRRVRLPVGARLDLGGIVKGWAADVALERFFGGFENVLINASGDMRVTSRLLLGLMRFVSMQAGRCRSVGRSLPCPRLLRHKGISIQGPETTWRVGPFTAHCRHPARVIVRRKLCPKEHPPSHERHRAQADERDEGFDQRMHIADRS
jgi:hypothetical protein